MNCPEHLVFKSRFLWVWMYWADVPRERIPLRIWLNPLRYEVSLHTAGRVRVMNREGRAARRIGYRVRKAVCRLFGHKSGRFNSCSRCWAQLPATNQEG